MAGTQLYFQTTDVYKESCFNLSEMSQKRLQGLQQYYVTVAYHPGAQQHIADMLSRHGCHPNDPADNARENETINCLTETIQALTETIAGPWKKDLKIKTANCSTLQAAMKVIAKGWPEEKERTNMLAKPFHSMRDEMAVYDGLAYRGERIVISSSLRAEVKQELHSSHQKIKATNDRNDG